MSFSPRGDMVGAMTQDIEGKQRKEGIRFAERIKRDDPNHGKYYCHHGKYVDSLRDLTKCERCVEAVITFMTNY